MSGVRFGNEERNSVRGPGFTSVDLSIFRRFPFAATHRLEARFEVFNLFNSPRFDNPTTANRTVGNPNFMWITTANQLFDRQIRIGVRYSF